MRRLSRKKRSGATVVEFAIVGPIVFLFFLGLMEWGRFEMVRQVMSTAAFNSARVGTLPGSTSAEAQDRAIEILEQYFVAGGQAVAFITPDESTMTITVPMSQNSFVLSRFFGNVTLERSFNLKIK